MSRLLPRARARSVLTLGTTALLLMGLVACSPANDNQEQDGGGDGGDLTLYSGRNETLVQPVLDAFADETGIDISVRYGGTAEMAAQLMEEGDRSPADAFLAQDAGALGALAAEDLLAPLPQESLDAVHEDYRSTGGDWVGLTGRSRVLVYNETAVTESELPDSVMDLTEEQWHGRVGIAPTNASFQTFVTAMRLLHGDEVTQQWLTDLAASDPEIRESNGVLVADVEAGVMDVALVNHYYLFEKAEEDGVTPEELDAALHFFPDGDAGALVNISGIGALGTEPSAEAIELIDYLLSPSAQEYFRDETHEYPMIAELDEAEGLPSLDSLEQPPVDLNDLDDLQTTVRMISEAGLG